MARDGAGRPVAFAGMTGSIRWVDCMYLCRSGVVPEYRGRGLQQRLILAREAQARRLGMNWLITETHGRTIQLPVYA